MNLEIFLIIGIAVDLLIGDPGWYRHPVQLIGYLCSFIENISRKVIQNEKTAGIITNLIVITTTLLTISCLVVIASNIHEIAGLIFLVFIIYSFVAIKDLFVHSRRVYNALDDSKDLMKARQAIGMIVGRDTSDLDRENICRGCVETVAENMVDGITAPLFWAVLFSTFSYFLHMGPLFLASLGIAFYKSVNTMDSMFGYKNERYINFGWFSAKLDDLVNFIPARLSGLCLVLSSIFIGGNLKDSYTILKRDRLKHASPNGGHPEAAVAGALGIELGGPSVYFGKKVDKPTLGDKKRIVEPNDIVLTNKIVFIGSTFFLIIILLLRRLIYLVLQ